MIGRKKEVNYLLSLLKENEPQFIAVFGRRRVGKTYLVRETFNNCFTFYHTGVSNANIDLKNRKMMQLNKFADSLKESGSSFDGILNNWQEAFSELKKVIISSKEQKKVVFIDELSWMDSRDSDLIPALENFWNGWASARKEKDIVLIVCASATYWIIENIVNSKGGLHNRLTGQIHLNQFTLQECEEYLKSRNIYYNRHQILQGYMIMGGIPYYWSLLKRGLSLTQNIDELFFKENAILSNEYSNLYSALFNNPGQYKDIVEALSLSNGGMTRDELCKKTKISSSGDFSRKLMELENCGFIRRYVPFGHKTKNTIYQLMDNYTLFYFKFLKDNIYNEDYWKEAFDSPKVRVWSGLAFEIVCLEHIYQIKKALGISGVYTEVNSWKCNKDIENGIFGSQIDLLIVRKDQVINLCEMKYSEAEYVVDNNFDMDMRRKKSDLVKITNTKYDIFPTLITTYGVIENSYSYNLQSVLTSDDLFQ